MALPIVKAIPTFNGGELDPALFGRVDVAAYYRSVAKARNCYSLVSGGMVRRPGLEFVARLHKAEPPALTGRRAIFIPFTDGGVDAVSGKATGALITVSWDQIKVYNVPALTVAATIVDSTFNGLNDDLTWTQKAGGKDIILFHPNVQSRRLSIATGTWVLSTLSFEAIPQHAYEDTTGSATNHQTKLKFDNFSEGGLGDRFTLFVDGVETDWITYDSTALDLAVNIKAAIDALPAIGAVTINAPVSDTVVVDFGGDAAGRRFIVTEGNLDDSHFATPVVHFIIITTETKGERPLEDVWSGTTGTGAEDDRGWPRCGTFFGNRLYLAGSPARPNVVWASRFGNAEDFLVLDDPTSGSPIEYVTDTDQGAEFNQAYVGRHLQFFSAGTEFYVPLSDSEALTPFNFTLRPTSSIGAMRGAPLASVEGSTIFLQRDGRGLRRFIFDDSQLNYRSFDLSLRGGHLLNVDPAPEMVSGGATYRLATLPMRQLAIQKSRDDENPDRIYIVNEAGDLVCVCVNEDEGVLGWHLWQTQGLFSQVVVVGDDVFVGVFRENDLSHDDDEPVHFIERFDSRLLLDAAAFDFAPTPGDAVSSDMTHLEADTGETNTVEVIVDGISQGTQEFSDTDTVAEFDPAAQTDWQVGIAFPDVKGDGSQVWVRTLPVEDESLKRVLLGDEKSVKRVLLQLLDTGSIEVEGNEVPLSNWTEAGDLSLHRQTGVFGSEALDNIDVFGQIDITQSKSDHMHILSMRLDVDLHGD